MGLLDDAIREHLELKRKHGADPEDLARQEREALGPGMRNEFAQPEQEAEPAQEPLAEAPVAEAAAPAAEPPRADPDAPAAVSLSRREDEWLDDRDEAAEDPQASRGDDEDVLEETPDFLQETPEHERLWFEQKPPRDFDWDK